MGDALGSLFSGYQAPETPRTIAVPKRDKISEDQTTRDAERRRLRARSGGVRSTLLTPQAPNPSSLLGLPS